MSLGSQKKYGAEKRLEEVLLVDPDKVLLTSDKAHPLYDERAATEPPRWFVKAVAKKGFGKLPPIFIRYEGDNPDGTPRCLVVDGRKRIQSARIINEENGFENKDKILVRALPWSGTDEEAADAVIVYNEGRVRDDLPTKIAKAQRRLAAGRSPEDVAEMFGITMKTLEKWLTVDDLAPAVSDAVMKEGVSLEAVLPLAKLPREEQGPALEEMRAAGKLTGPAAKTEAEKKANRGKPKKKQKRSLKYAELEAKRQEILKMPKRSRYWEGVIAGLAFAQGEKASKAFEDAPGGD